MATASAATIRMFRQRFPAGTTVRVPVGRDASAAAAAGLRIIYQPVGLWPYPGLLTLPSMVRPAAWEDIQWHNHVRDLFADSVRAAPNGQAIVEVTLTTGTGARADADIVARGPRGVPGVTPQAFFEIKTGTFSEVRPNQQYVYALAVTGGHVTSWHPQLPMVGLTPGVLIPAMDFLLIVSEPPDWTPIPHMFPARLVDQGATLGQIMATIAGLEAAR